MLLKGYCHCGSVQFQLQSPHPYPFNYCYCSICRKTAGGGGYAINLSGDFNTLEVQGKEYINVYHARLNGKTSDGERHFCKHCGSALWVYDSNWPDLVHPHASAIDTELPKPPEKVHLMLASKASWVDVVLGPRDRVFDEYPDESIAAWHERLGLIID